MSIVVYSNLEGKKAVISHVLKRINCVDVAYYYFPFRADIGVIGLAVMGQNLILNMNDHGFVVCAYNRSPEKVTAFLENEAKDTKASERGQKGGTTPLPHTFPVGEMHLRVAEFCYCFCLYNRTYKGNYGPEIPTKKGPYDFSSNSF